MLLAPSLLPNIWATGTRVEKMLVNLDLKKLAGMVSWLKMGGKLINFNFLSASLSEMMWIAILVFWTYLSHLKSYSDGVKIHVGLLN